MAISFLQKKCGSFAIKGKRPKNVKIKYNLPWLPQQYQYVRSADQGTSLSYTTKSIKKRIIIFDCYDLIIRNVRPFSV